MSVYGEKWFDDCDFATREDMVAGIGIGTTVLEFDESRRVYPPPPPGKTYPTCGPMHRGHYQRIEVVGETSRSWILAGWSGCKIPKKSLAGIYSNQCADRAGWLRENQHKIVEQLRRHLNDVETYDLAVQLAERLGIKTP